MIKELFFDLEFTGLHKDTTLISIGLVSKNGDKFYGIVTDYDESQVDEWIEKNVIRNLEIDYNYESCQIYKSTKKGIREALNRWLKKIFGEDMIQCVSDVSHYDFVLFVDLLTNGGTAFDLPKNVSPVCHDINQDIAEYLDITDKEAFDLNREEFIENEGWSLPEGDKHNSLYDALVIKQIYDIIQNFYNDIEEEYIYR